MIVLWAAATLLVIVALSLVLPPLWSDGDTARSDHPSIDDANAFVYRAQLAEMQRESSGDEDRHDRYARDRADLELRLASDLARSMPHARLTEPPLTSRTLAYVLALAIPVLASLLYLALSSSAIRPS